MWKRLLDGDLSRTGSRSGHLFFAALVCVGMSRATLASQTALANGDIRIQISDGLAAPSLDSIAEGHGITWRNNAVEKLPAFVEDEGKQVPLHWSLKKSLNRVQSNRVVFVYESAEPRLRLEWEWQARSAFGPVEHRVRVQNLSGRLVWLPLVDSLDLTLPVGPCEPLHNFYVEKGADTPSEQGTHLEEIADGYRWIGRSSTYAHPEKDEAREIIPVAFLSRGAVTGDGLYAGIEFSGRTRISVERHGDQVESRVGLNDELGFFRTRLDAGATFETPTAFLGAYRGDIDGAGNQLRAWVRSVLNRRATIEDPRYPYTVSNSWGSGMQVDEALALKMVHEARDLGIEIFHLDAGWFRAVGDWHADAKKFPHGLAYIADQAHQAGMRFGLWVDWAQAGVSADAGALNVNAPEVRDWLVNDVGADWKPEEFKGQTIDLGVPAAQAYAGKELDRIVSDNHLDMLEHDGYLVAQGCTRSEHPHAAPNLSSVAITHDSGFDFVRSSNSTDVSYHAVRAYYEIYEKLREDHPQLLLEICNDGGRMVDFGSAAHGDYFSITDTYDPLSNRRAFYDASFALPPAMLESYVEKWKAQSVDNFLYMLRSGMMGWMSLMQDTAQWSPEERIAARNAIALYKEKLRPLIRTAQLYHVSPRPDGVHWDGMEYMDLSARDGVLFAFRGSAKDEPSHAFVLKGLVTGRRYRLHFEDGRMPDLIKSGEALMRDGLTVRLAGPLSSELVFLSEEPETAGRGHAR